MSESSKTLFALIRFATSIIWPQTEGSPYLKNVEVAPQWQERLFIQTPGEIDLDSKGRREIFYNVENSGFFLLL